jgi:hypothetical protein
MFHQEARHLVGGRSVGHAERDLDPDSPVGEGQVRHLLRDQVRVRDDHLEALIMGVFELIRGFQGGGAGAFILGVINVLIGLLLVGRPMAAALAVPFVFGVLLLIEGVGLLIAAFRARA